MKTQKKIDVSNLNDEQLKKLLKIDSPGVREAVAEYIRREAIYREMNKAEKISGSREAAAHLMPLFYNLDVEQFHILLLNRANKIIGTRKISEGGMSGTVVDPKVIFYKAIQAKASGIIMAHNHPSGNLKPSDSDIQLTKKMKEGGRLLEISILDHLIISNNSYYSFADEGSL